MPQALIASFLKPTELASSGAAGGTAPSAIQIFPAGADLATEDGRKFRITDVEALAAKLNARGRDVLVDYDHRSHFMPDEGGSTEAAGWITSFEARDGALWGLVEWTVDGAAKVAARLFRFISPEFHTTGKTMEITAVEAVSLVNRPAFSMPSLARKQDQQTGDTPMNEIAKKLGLPEDADEATILAALDKRDADAKAELASAQSKAKTPSVTEFMPRGDYDAVLARAETAETKLKDGETATFKAKVDATLAAAVTAGKITPGSRDHYVALCTDQAALDGVIAAIGAAPVVTTGTGLDGKQPDSTGAQLTAEQSQMASRLGISEDDYVKQLAADRAATNRAA